MKRARWREGFGLPVLLLSAMLSTAVTPAAMSAGLLPAILRGCCCASVTPAVAGRAATDAGPGAGFARVTAQLAKKGELTGRILTGRAANGAPISVALPVESYVGPAGRQRRPVHAQLVRDGQRGSRNRSQQRLRHQACRAV